MPFGYYMPKPAKSIVVKIPEPKQNKLYFSPFPEDGAVSGFLSALANNAEDAWAFISKSCTPDIDLYALKDELKLSDCKYFTAMRSSYCGKNSGRTRTKALMINDKELNEKRVLYLHMVREPDSFSQWKIFSIEREY